MCSMPPYPDFEVRESSMLCAIRNNNLDDVKNLLKNGDVNIPVVTSGSLAGYTALHIACMENKLNLVKMLIEDLKADVNVTAADGSQPLILSGLLGNLGIARVLIKCNTNVDAEFSQNLQLKFAENKKWCNEFGDRITLLIFAVVNNDTNLTRILVVHSNVNLKFKTISGKTLVMFAIENGNYQIVDSICKIEDRKFINARDDDGIPATHYPFLKNKGEFRYDTRQLSLDSDIGWSLRCLVGNGADVFAMINNNPSTLLLNIAAYKGFCETLQYLLPYYTFLTNSTALYSATLPVQDPKKEVSTFPPGSSSRALEKARKKTVKVILKDLVNRRTFGFYVPEQEKILMDKLIATNITVKNYVQNYKEKFINGVLKSKVIQSHMTIFDFVMESVSDMKLKLFVRNRNLTDEFFRVCNECFMKNYNILWFTVMYRTRMKIVERRIELLEKLEDISLLRKFIPLPYELVLDVVEYLSNEDLKEFIDSFINI